ADKRLQGGGAGLDVVGRLAEQLGGGGAVVGLEALGETGEGDRALALDGMPGVGGAEAEAEGAEFGAAVGAEMEAVEGRRGAPVVDLQVAAVVAGEEADAPALGERGVGAEQDAAQRAVEAGGIAVAVTRAPAAESLGPGRDAPRFRRRRRQV